MVEMQFVRRITSNAFSAITFPDFQLDLSRNNATPYRRADRSRRHFLLVFDCDQFEFKDLSVSVVFGPRVYQFEQSIVRPNSRPDFFISAYSLGFSPSSFCSLSRHLEFTVLSEPS